MNIHCWTSNGSYRHDTHPRADIFWYVTAVRVRCGGFCITSADMRPSLVVWHYSRMQKQNDKFNKPPDETIGTLSKMFNQMNIQHLLEGSISSIFLALWACSLQQNVNLNSLPEVYDGFFFCVVREMRLRSCEPLLIPLSQRVSLL